MKPRMKFYNNGDRVFTSNMIIPYDLLTYVMQLNKEDDKRFIDNTQRWSFNTSVMIPCGINPTTGFTRYVKKT
jgi:uncharacterized membrane protein